MIKEKKSIPAQPSLVGEKIYLRPATAQDVSNWYLWGIQEGLQTLGCWPQTITTAEEAMEQFKSKEHNPDAQDFAIIRRKENLLIGKVAFFNYNSLNRSAELGLLIDPDEREKGHGKDALRLLCQHLFKTRGLNKVYAQTAEFNKGAVKLLESLQFKQDATLRNHYFHDGCFWAGYIYSLLLFEFD